MSGQELSQNSIARIASEGGSSTSDAAQQLRTGSVEVLPHATVTPHDRASSTSAVEAQPGGAPALLPLFLKLDGRRVLIVGGGPIAAAKLQSLAGTGADVHVVAPETVTAIREARDLTLHARVFEPSDLDGAWLVITAATPARANVSDEIPGRIHLWAS